MTKTNLWLFQQQQKSKLSELLNYYKFYTKLICGWKPKFIFYLLCIKSNINLQVLAKKKKEAWIDCIVKCGCGFWTWFAYAFAEHSTDLSVKDGLFPIFLVLRSKVIVFGNDLNDQVFCYGLGSPSLCFLIMCICVSIYLSVCVLVLVSYPVVV